jgi:thiol:disulfide interchange protein DsbD
MDAIKFILGAAMWCAALYYAQFLLTTRLHIALIALSFFALALWKGAFHFHKKNYIKQSFLLALFIFSTSVLVISAFRPEYLSTAFSLNTNTEKSKLANWAPYSAELLALAKQENKPVMIDFFADWCAACHELDNKTFNTDEFKQLSEGFILLKFDATNETPAILDVLKKYNVKGLPTVLFINRNGTLLNELTFTQFLEISALKPKMQEALK